MKSGLHWGENSVRPYPVGVTTASGEAARMVISRFLGLDRTGRNPLFNCTTNSAYRPCALVRDDNSMHVVLVNDGVITATSGAGKPQGLMVGIDLRPLIADWSIQNGSIAVVNELSSAGYWGEVSGLVTITAPLYQINWPLPTWGVMTVSIPLGRQVVTVFPATDDTTVAAGVNVNANYGSATTLTVGTSINATHDTTRVAFIQFDVTGVDPTTINSAILELTVASVASTVSLLTVVAVTDALKWSEGSLTWATAGAAGVLNATMSGPVNCVGANFVTLDLNNQVAGHISVRPTDLGVVKRLDVTDILVNNGACFVTDIALSSARAHALAIHFVLRRRRRDHRLCARAAHAQQPLHRQRGARGRLPGGHAERRHGGQLCQQGGRRRRATRSAAAAGFCAVAAAAAAEPAAAEPAASEPAAPPPA